MRPRPLPLALLLAGLAQLAGCGYSTGMHLAPGYESVGIELFGNDSPARDLERELHVALTKVVRDRVSAPLQAPGRSDLVVRGTILEYHFRPGLRDKDNQQIETALIVRARATLWDRRRDEQVGSPVQAQSQAGYALDAPFGEANARRRVLDNVAERLVLELLASSAASAGPERPSDDVKQ